MKAAADISVCFSHNTIRLFACGDNDHVIDVWDLRRIRRQLAELRFT